MNKNIKYIAVVIIISAIISYFSFYRTEIILDAGLEYQGEIVKSDISVEEGYISISSFTDLVKEDTWISNNEVVIKAKHETEGISNYKFNTDDVNLEKLDLELGIVVLSKIRYDLAYRLDDYDMILTRDNDDYTELYLYKKEKLTQIGTLKIMDRKPFLVSKDLSKILFLDKENEINTYGIYNSKKKSSILEFESDLSSDFFSRFEISDDGGFFSYSLLNDNFSESSFYIYGADSGRLYAKDIIGVKPSFSSLSNKVAFFYSGDVISNQLSKSRIGVLNLKSKKITYYDRTDDGEMYVGDIKWTKDNKKIVFTSLINDENFIHVLDIEKMLKLNYNVKDVELLNNISVVANKVYWIADVKGFKQLSILETTGKSPTYINKLKVIYPSRDEYIISTNEDVFVLQGNYLLKVSDEVNVQLAYIDEYTNLLSISPDGEHILAQKNIEGKVEIKIYTIK